jgi:hypothetical protein
MLDHQAAILHDLDAGLGELLCRIIIANAGLKPNGLRFFRQYVQYMPVDVM